MTNTQKLALKAKLKQLGLDIIAQRIAIARDAANEAQQSANQEEKSSAGDKYETGRAMGHLQKEMYSRQQAEHQRDFAALQQIKVDAIYTAPVPGSFIQLPGSGPHGTGDSLSEGQTSTLSGKRGTLSESRFFGIFIAAGLGRQILDGKTILFLSPAAPLTKTLFNKKPGDELFFNGLTLRIEDIY